jgi:hypothetical protein
MRRNRFFKLDYSMLSSYLGRWATVFVFACIIIIAVGALFLQEDDIAHMPVTIGVYDLDSTVVHSRLEDLAAFIREKGGGDIRWAYVGTGKGPEGCDLYLMSSLRLAPYLERGDLDCSILVTVREGRRYSRGVVIGRVGECNLTGNDVNVIFSSSLSAAGFLSPYRALCDAGLVIPSESGRIDFAGEEGRVVFGVIYGAYTFGGISLERFQHLEEIGTVQRGELEVVLEGAPYPEMVLAADRSMDDRKHRRFRDRFLLLAEHLPSAVRTDLLSIGISGFVMPRQEDVDLIKKLPGLLPAGIAHAAGVNDIGK